AFELADSNLRYVSTPEPEPEPQTEATPSNAG
uniref:Transcriptional regulator n=1 Tax=Bursaphelenchus xylophilus TaxID=6326 RepID=A0A1I7SPS0_BURXY